MSQVTEQSVDRKSGSAGMPRPISYAVFCLKNKTPAPYYYFYLLCIFFFLIILPPSISPLFPYTTLFRSTFVKDWFRYESHFVHGRDSLVDILKERGLLSESDAVQPLIGKKS